MINKLLVVVLVSCYGVAAMLAIIGEGVKANIIGAVTVALCLVFILTLNQSKLLKIMAVWLVVCVSIHAVSIFYANQSPVLFFAPILASLTLLLVVANRQNELNEE